MVSKLASRSSCPAPSSIRNFYIETIVDVGEVDQRHCLEESGQWVKNVDTIHLELASGNLVLQKIVLGTISVFSSSPPYSKQVLDSRSSTGEIYWP